MPRRSWACERTAFSLLLLSLACAPPESRAPASVIVITIDTLRADHLSCYGYAKPTSPAIDAFARRATRYEDCVATAPWTLPSHASLFTGRFPSEHGAHIVKREEPSGRRDERHALIPLAEENVTLAEVFAQEGYATAAFVANDAFLGEEMQLDQGFATYAVERLEAGALTDRALDWIERQGSGSFFLFLNYMDAHCPCTLEPRSADPLPAPRRREGRTLMAGLAHLLITTGDPAPQDVLDELVAQYDTGIAFADEHIGRLLARLEELGRYDSTSIVLTSDHGEFFGEHRLMEHGRDVYQEVLWVPLIVKAPGQTRGAVEERRVCTADLPRIVLRQVGRLARDWTEQFPYEPSNHPVLVENHYSRRGDLKRKAYAKRFDRVRSAFYDGSTKYIESSDGECELYDLSRDPREEENLIDSRPDLRARMEEGLRAFRARMARPPAPGAEVVTTPEEARELEELGY